MNPTDKRQDYFEKLISAALDFQDLTNLTKEQRALAAEIYDACHRLEYALERK